MAKECEVCGESITAENPQTKHCPDCDRLQCTACDMGEGIVCFDCEEEG